MYQSQFDPNGDSGGNPGGGPMSVLKLVALVAGVGFIAAVVLGFSFWALGWLFGLVFWLLKVAFVVCLCAFIWRRVCHRQGRYGRHYEV